MARCQIAVRHHVRRPLPDGVRKRVTHKILHSLGSWSSFRLWSDRWPGSESPFCALAVPVNLDDGGIDHSVFHVRFFRQGIENSLENISFSPIAEAPERRAPVAEHRWQIAPWTARSHNPQHRLHKKPVVPAASTRVRRLTQAVRLHLRPLGIGQDKAFHPKYESHLRQNGNPESPQSLGRFCCRFPLLFRNKQEKTLCPTGFKTAQAAGPWYRRQLRSPMRR